MCWKTKRREGKLAARWYSGKSCRLSAWRSQVCLLESVWSYVPRTRGFPSHTRNVHVPFRGTVKLFVGESEDGQLSRLSPCPHDGQRNSRGGHLQKGHQTSVFLFFSHPASFLVAGLVVLSQTFSPKLSSTFTVSEFSLQTQNECIFFFIVIFSMGVW